MDKTIRLFLSLVLCLLAVSFSFAEDAEKDEADKKLEAAIENLESPNWYLRGSAILDLVQHEDEKVDKGIERALESNYPFVKLAACKAIRLRKMENMLDKVVEVCLDSTYVAVVDSAAKTIASLNSEEGFKKLYEAWNERSGRPGLNFGRSLRYFKDVDLEGLIEKIVKNNKSEMLTAYTIEAATVNGIHTDRLEQSVLSIKPKTAVLQYCMSEYLSTCPDSKAAVNYLMNQIKSREAPIAMRAGTSLAKLKHSNPDDLMSYARKKANPPSSNAALKAIALNHYAPDASKVSSLLSDKHSRDRISGCIYVAKFPSKRLLQHVEKLALSDEDEQVRLYAMRTLVLQDPETATKAIGNLLESSDDINRITALMGIAYTRDEKHMPLVIKAFSNGLSQRAAAAAGYALLCLNPASALEEMEALLKKNDADIAMPVIIALGQLPFGKSVELLISTLNTNFEAIRNASSEQLMLLTGCNFPPQQKVWNKWWEKKKEYLDPFNSRWLPVPEKEKEDGEDEKDDEGKVEKGLEQVFLWHKPKTSLFTSIADRRKETVKKFDNDFLGEQMVESGLLWLANFQDMDGKWSSKGYKRLADDPNSVAMGIGEEYWDLAVTAMAALAFMDAGYSPGEGRYGRIIERALDYIACLVTSNGSLTSKQLAGSKLEGEMFEHALICEALAQGLLAGYDKHRETVQRMVDFLCTQQDKNKGGWGWTPDKNSNFCTPTTTYVVEALYKAEKAGIELMPGTRALALNWYKNEVSAPVNQYQFIPDEDMSQDEYDKKITAKSSAGWDDRSFFASNTAMTAYALSLFGAHRNNTHVISKLNLLKDYSPDQWSTPGSINKSYPHHYQMYLTRSRELRGGKAFTDWYEGMCKFLNEKMEKGGEAHGSWQPQGWDGQRGGRILATAMTVVTLTTPYGLTSHNLNGRIFELPKDEKEKKEKDE